MIDRMIVRNDIMDRARLRFMEKHGAPKVGDDWGAYVAEMSAWKKATGFDRYIQRVGNLAFRKLGYVKSPHGGWMRND